MDINTGWGVLQGIRRGKKAKRETGEESEK